MPNRKTSALPTAKGAQVHERVLGQKRPRDKPDEADDEESGHPAQPHCVEPVIFLPLVEQYL